MGDGCLVLERGLADGLGRLGSGLFLNTLGCVAALLRRSLRVRSSLASRDTRMTNIRIVALWIPGVPEGRIKILPLILLALFMYIAAVLASERSA